MKRKALIPKGKQEKQSEKMVEKGKTNKREKGCYRKEPSQGSAGITRGRKELKKGFLEWKTRR